MYTPFAIAIMVLIYNGLLARGEPFQAVSFKFFLLSISLIEINIPFIKAATEKEIIIPIAKTIKDTLMDSIIFLNLLKIFCRDLSVYVFACCVQSITSLFN